MSAHRFAWGVLTVPSLCVFPICATPRNDFNIVSQDHCGIEHLVRPVLGFGRLPAASRTMVGYEAMVAFGKGQVQRRRTRHGVTSHVANARRSRPARPGGLMEAIVAAMDEGQTFPEAFDAREVACANTVTEARKRVSEWIANLDASCPNGLNTMPGARLL